VAGNIFVAFWQPSVKGYLEVPQIEPPTLNIIYNLATNLNMTFLSKSYYNERHSDQIFFFGTSRSKVGKKCVTNMIKNYKTKWKFEWFGLDLLNFKR